MDTHRQSFFGQKAGIIIKSPSMYEPFIFLKLVKKKGDGTWEKLSLGEGKTVKCSLEEMIMMHKVLKQKASKWKTYHQYKDTGTDIAFQWEQFKGEECLMVKVGTYRRQFSVAQADVFRRLMKHMIKEKIEFATSGTSFQANKDEPQIKSAEPETEKLDLLPPQEPIHLSDEPLNDETTSIKGKIEAETEKALLIVFDVGNEKWVPKSKIRSNYSSQIGVPQSFVIETWVLTKK